MSFKFRLIATVLAAIVALGGLNLAALHQVRALDREGRSFDLEADGLLAICIQHEMDHLMGRVFVEYLSPLKRNRIRTKLLKRGREDEAAE